MQRGGEGRGLRGRQPKANDDDNDDDGDDDDDDNDDHVTQY